MRVSRRIATTAALAAVAVGGATALAGPASAATQATYNGVCGSGYTVIDQTPVSDLGTIFITWNGTTGKNCAVTVRNNPGTAFPMGISLNTKTSQPTTPVTDEGQYTTYAGPVYVDARGVCITWEGHIQGITASGGGHCNG
jgi:hypothetical protein